MIFFKRLLPLCLLLLLTTVAIAQHTGKKDAYLFKGQLVDADAGTVVTLAHITNPYKGTITVSDQAGAFVLPVEGGDTLLVSRVGCTTLKYVTPQQATAEIMVLKLQPKTEELREVVITRFPSEGRFKEQLLGLQLPEEQQPFLNIPHPSTVVVPNTDGDFTIAKAEGAISGFANRFNNKERGRQFKAKIALQEQQEAYIATRFNKYIVQQITGLEDEEKLNEFMKFCVLSNDFLLKASEYEIHEAVLGCFKDFVASR